MILNVIETRDYCLLAGRLLLGAKQLISSFSSSLSRYITDMDYIHISITYAHGQQSRLKLHFILISWIYTCQSDSNKQYSFYSYTYISILIRINVCIAPLLYYLSLSRSFFLYTPESFYLIPNA